MYGDRRSFLCLVVAALVTTVTGCLDASSPDNQTTAESRHETTVTIRDGTFSPATLEAATGQEITVVFANRDDRAYDLATDFDDLEVRIPPETTIRERIEVPAKPGTYEIVCDGFDRSVTLESVPADVLGGCGYDSTDE